MTAITDEKRQRQAASIAAWLRVFVAPEQVTELRALHLPDRKIACAYFAGTNLDAMARRAIELERAGAKGVYFTPNPVRPELISARAAAKDEDVTARRWLLIDVDPIRPADLSATQVEREAAWKVMESVWSTLDGAEFKGGVLGDSGNGWHVCYPLDMPNDEPSKQLVRRLLRELHARCSTERAKVDTSTFNAARIWKVYGTRSRKGRADPERPWRWARLLDAPPPAPWAAEAAQGNAKALAAVLDRWDRAARMRGGKTLAHVDGPGAAWAHAALRQEVAAVAGAQPGERNNRLNASAFALYQIVAGGYLTDAEVTGELKAAALGGGLPEAEVDRTLASARAAGTARPRSAPLNGHALNGYAPASPAPASASDTVPKGQRIVDRASEITPRVVEWLWPARIPLGKLTTFAGVGGLGKTFVLLDIAARITRGSEWPDFPGAKIPPGRVLFISGEDDPDDTLVPRLIELGADLSRVCFLKPAIADRFTLADLKTLARAAEETGPDLRMVAIDPPTAYLGGVDDHKNAELRGLLAPLATWSSERRCATILNTHVNKSTGSHDALMRVMGSVAWVNAVRAAHIFARDEEDESRVLFIPAKVNLGPRRPGLAYRIIPSGPHLARVEWLGEVNKSADQAMGKQVGEKRTRAVVASEWLVERFREQREWSSQELFERGKQDGLSKNALYDAKDRLQLPKARRVEAPNGDVSWKWWVPENWPLLTPSGNRETGNPEEKRI